MLARTALLVSAVGLLASASSANVIISDGVFAPADWSLISIDVGGNGSTTTVSQQLTGGNPNEYRRVFNSVASTPNSAIWGLHLYLPSSYDPSNQGVVSSVCYSEDAILFAGAGSGQASGMLIEQSGKYFVGPSHATAFASWTNISDPVLLQSNFSEINPGSGALNAFSNPDFSAAGGVMQFGFFRANSTSGGAYTRDGGIDNWSVCIVPAPGSAALLAGAGCLAMRRRRSA
ncbi:MAG: hypothetical protein ACF8LK_06855 [Phycisphaerales bacterium JB041]